MICRPPWGLNQWLYSITGAYAPRLSHYRPKGLNEYLEFMILYGKDTTLFSIMQMKLLSWCHKSAAKA